MRGLKQVECPWCEATLRFLPGKAMIFVISCPRCEQHFEIRNASASMNPSSMGTRSTGSTRAAVEAELVDSAAEKTTLPEVQEQPVKLGPEALRRPEFAEIVDLPETGSADHTPIKNIAKPVAHSPRDLRVRETDPLAGVNRALRGQQRKQADIHSGKSPNRSSGAKQAQNKTTGPAQSKVPRLLIFLFSTVLALAITALVVFLSLSKSGRLQLAAWNPLATTAVGIAEELAPLLDEYLEIIDSLESERDREWAAGRLQDLQPKIESMFFASLRAEEISEDQYLRIDKLLGENTPTRTEIDRYVQQLSQGRPRHDPLKAILVETEDALTALRGSLRSIVRIEIPGPSEADQVVWQVLLVQESIVRTLASSLHETEIQNLRELQRAADRIAGLAEQQALRRIAIDAVSPEIAQCDQDLSVARDFIVARLREQFNPGREFALTMDEIRYVEDRFDQALFDVPLEELLSNCRERVLSRLNGNPASRPANAIGSSLAAEKKRAVFEAHFNSVGQEYRYRETPPTENRAATTNRPSTSKPTDVENTASQRDAESIPTGSGPITLVISNASRLNPAVVEKHLSSKLAVQILETRYDEEEIRLTVDYGGPLAHVAALVNFGEIVLTDTESRTIYIEAE